MRGAQLLAGISPPPLAAQPLTVEEVGPGKRHADAGAAEVVESTPAVRAEVRRWERGRSSRVTFTPLTTGTGPVRDSSGFIR